MADPVPDFRELAEQEFSERKDWWKEAEPRAPLPDHLLEKLEQNDPEFVKRNCVGLSVIFYPVIAIIQKLVEESGLTGESG